LIFGSYFFYGEMKKNASVKPMILTGSQRLYSREQGARTMEGIT